MKTDKILIGACILVLLASMPAFAGSISISSVSIPSSVSQGDSFNIVMSITGSSATDVTGSASVPSGITCSPTSAQSISLNTEGAGSATWSCTASVAGDYSNQVSATVNGLDSETGAPLSDSEQTGLSVLLPASLAASSSISAATMSTAQTVTLSVGVNNAGDTSTTYSIAVASSPTGVTPALASGSASGTLDGDSVTTAEYTLSSSTAGTYTVTATITGGNGQTVTSSETLTVTAVTAEGNSTTTTTGGSSSAAASNSTLSANTARITIATAASGSTKTVDVGLKSNITAVNRLSFTLTSSAAGVEILIDKHSTKPASAATFPPTGKIFAYLEINHTNLTNSQLSGVQIDFHVNKSWITANSVDRNEIVLYRLNSGSWGSLTTTNVAEDSDNVVYRADSPGLSVFAIWAPPDAVDSGSAPDMPVTSAGAGDTEDTTTTPEPLLGDTNRELTGNEIATAVMAEGQEMIYLIVAVPVVVIAAIAGLFLYSKKKGKKPYNFRKPQRDDDDDDDRKKGKGEPLFRRFTEAAGGHLKIVVIALIVVAVLVAVLSFTSQGSSLKTCTGFQYFTYMDQKLDSNGIILDMMNGDNAVTVTGIKVNGIDGSSMQSIPTTFEPGQRGLIQASVSGLGDPGSQYNYPVILTYDVTNGIIGNSDRGDCRGKVV